MAEREDPRPPPAAAAVSAALRAQGLRQIDLAERVGVTPNTVSRWLAGRVVPTTAQVAAIAQALGDSELDRASLWLGSAHPA